MVGKRQIIRHPSIVSPEETALERYVPDLANWPRSWSVDESDAAIGQQILDVLRPFLLELLAQQRSKKTLRRDRDHLWMLGGELIRRRCDDPDLAALPVATLLFNLIEEDGGPSSGRASPSPSRNPSMPPAESSIAISIDLKAPNRG
ncbi:hypothetical protein AWB81_08344 [Caballeronia arationis]|uniref:hypothetical protein n=1 Tax=Caballeronia arationis TaxID=1777142 RepID=UPI00074B7DDD|nr:hypothetical protein [Caballeronia arationis]SAL07850.1 hypothetical protein AWB81_08344 [Caballeronia arationis]